MEEQNILFEEKQYLGFNKFSLSRRIVLAIFCFLVYYYSIESPEAIGVDNAGEFLFYMGIVILCISVLLLFVLHIKTTVINGSIILDGLWTARKVKIDLNSIISAKKVNYSRYLLNRPVYNLHLKGKIKFFTKGKDAIELEDKDGLIYLIGSQKASELEKILADQIKKNHA